MKRLLGIAFALFIIDASPAFAVCPASLQLKDNAGVTAPGKYIDDGSGNCQPSVILGTNQGEAGVPGTGFTQPTGGSGISGWLSGIYHALTNPLPLPTGAATAANQTAMTNTLNTIHTDLGTLNTTAGNPLAAGTNIIGKVGIDQTTPGTTNGVQAIAGATGGATSGGSASGIAANTNNATNIKASAGTVYDIQTGNINATTAYFLKLYDKATAPTCGTDTPVKRILIPPANSGNNVTLPVGVKFSTGIGFCIVAGIADTDNTAVPAATVLFNIDWN